MTFKERYGKYNEEIQPNVEMMQGIMEKAVKRPSFTAILRPGAAVVAVCLCLLITMPVLADGMPYVEKLLNLISPNLAQQFIPVQLSDEKEGIRMEVVAIKVQEDGAQVYITMQDLEGGRLDETTDLYDSYRLSIPFDSVSSCSNLGYNPDTHTVTFLVSISPMEGARDDWYEEIKNSRITFSVREIIGQKTTYEELAIPIPLTEAGLQAESVATHLNGGSYSHVAGATSGADLQDPRPVCRVLLPGEGDVRFPVKDILFTGMGYVEDKLHIQYGVEEGLKNDNHGHFFLKDKQGNKRIFDAKVSFWGTTEETRHNGYEDCIFDIPAEQLSDYSLYGYFVTSGLYLEGNWKVKFRLGQGQL